MNIDSLLNLVFGYYHQYPWLAGVLAVLLLLWIWKKPKAFFKFCLLLAVIAAFFYAISLFGGVVSSGGEGTSEVGSKSRKQIERQLK